MYPKEKPCERLSDTNPSIVSTFTDFVTWKNREDGVLGELLGAIEFKNMKVADSKVSGFEAYKTNFAPEGVLVENFMIIGKSNNPETEENYYMNTRAIVAPRTNQFRVNNVRMYNFD